MHMCTRDGSLIYAPAMRYLSALALLLALNACGGGDGDQEAAPTETVTVTETTEVTVTETVTAEPPEADELALKPRNFALRVKTKSKECFGSAGCNVEYEIEPTFIGPGGVAQLDAVTVDVTYRVTGAEDEIIGTITFDGGSYDVVTESTSTTSSDAVLEARAIDVEVY